MVCSRTPTAWLHALAASIDKPRFEVGWSPNKAPVYSSVNRGQHSSSPRVRTDWLAQFEVSGRLRDILLSLGMSIGSSKYLDTWLVRRRMRERQWKTSNVCLTDASVVTSPILLVCSLVELVPCTHKKRTWCACQTHTFWNPGSLFILSEVRRAFSQGDDGAPPRQNATSPAHWPTQRTLQGSSRGRLPLTDVKKRADGRTDTDVDALRHGSNKST